MFSDRTIGRIVGVLFIVASAAAIVGGSLLLPLDEPDYLVQVAAKHGQIVTGAGIELILVVSVVAIAVLVHPILKRYDDALALGYVGARTLEAVLLLGAAVSALLVLSVSQNAGGAVDQVGDTLLATRQWSYLLGSLVIFGLTALILNGVLVGARLVPAWISVWGVIGGGLVLLRGVLDMYDVGLSGVVEALFTAPIGVQEMVLAVWLIVRGFDTSHLGWRRMGAVTEPAGILTKEPV